MASITNIPPKTRVLVLARCLWCDLFAARPRAACRAASSYRPRLDSRRLSVGADLSAGTVDLGVSVAGLDLDLDVGLHLDDDPATDTGSSTTDTATDSGNTGIVDVGGLLDGLLRRPGRR